MGFISPSRGQVELFGLSPRNPESRRRVGFLPESFAYDRYTTGRKLLRRFDALSGQRAAGREKRVEEALGVLDMLAAADRRVSTYSKGMTQRIGMAQALLGDPELLILDEPMSGMDPATRYSVRELLGARRDREKATLFSTHILSDVEALADRVIILDRGRMVAEGTLEELRAAGRGTVIAFRDDRPERFDGMLGELGLTREGVAQNGRLQRVTARDEGAKNAALARLAGKGADIVSVVPVETSLETLFLDLTGTRDRDRDSGNSVETRS
jgi:ABC-2 type transport system ATP-binding protein